jgi:hypothetical protein
MPLRQRDGWINAAAMHHRNEEYYRGLLDQIGAALGTEAYTSDDGSMQDSVLRSKVPELVLARLTPSEPTEAMLTAAHDWSYAKYGKPIGNDAAIGCWRAMRDAAAPAAADRQATDRFSAKVRELVR